MSVSGQLEINMCKFTWSLNNFSTLGKKPGDKITSPVFDIKGLQWRILLYPYGSTSSSNNYMSIYLKSESQTEIKIYFEFMLSDTIGTELGQMGAIYLFTKGEGQGWLQLIKRDSLLDGKGKLLDDTLNVTCMIQTDVYSTKEISIQKTILHDYEALFFNENFSDLTITINNNRMKAHKSILAARSEVFKAMFCHDMKENNTNTLKITDVSYNIMKEVLLFIYSGKVNNLKQNARKLLPPAEKYGIIELKVLCEKSIMKDVKIEDACETLNFAHLYQCSELKTKIIEFIITNIKEINKTPGCKNLMKSNPELFEQIFDKLVEQKS